MRRWTAVYGILSALAVGTVRSEAAEVAWFDGRPAFAEGADRGYYVWRDGDRWHVRWTTRGTPRRFTGHVSAEGGDLESLKRIDVEEESRIVAAGRPSRVVRGPRGRLHVRGGRGPVVATREQDKIEKQGDRRIAWTSRTDADIDGFDFTISKDVRRLRFVLEIDGESRATEVELGRESRRPAHNPFEVQLR